MPSSLRSDIESLALMALKDLPQSDTSLVLRECASKGTERSLKDAIASAHEKTRPRLGVEEVVIPAFLSTAQERDAFVAAAHAEAERVVAGNTERPLSEVLPQLLKVATQQSKQGETVLGTAATDAANAGKAVADATLRATLELDRFNPETSLLELRRNLLHRERWFVAIEALTIFGAIAAFCGVSDDATSLTAWLQCVTMSLGTVAAGLGLAWAAAKLTAKTAPSRRLLIVGGLGIATAALALAASFALVRVAAAATRVSAGLEAAGSAGMAVIVAISSVVVFITVVLTRRQLFTVDEELSEIARRKAAHARERERLVEIHGAAEAVLSRARADAQAVTIAEQAFEASVQRIAEAFRAHRSVLHDREAKALAAFKMLKDQPDPVREAIATALFELRPASSVDTPKSRSSMPLASLSVMLLLSTLAACTEKEPNSLMVVCDASAAHGCSPGALGHTFASWGRATTVPESRFEIIYVAGSLSDTVVAEPLVVRARSRAERWQWLDQTAAHLAAEPLPNIPNGVRDNKSDLLSALIAAIAAARAHPMHRHELIVMSDGLFISPSWSVNAEKQLPMPQELFAKLKAARVTINLADFAAVTICGFDNHGMTAATLEARRKLWTEFIVGSHGPPPVITTSCRDHD